MSKGNVLVFTAHADDCEFFAGGTVAKFIAEGYEVYEVITTNNERGSFDLDRETLVSDSRDKEAREAARIMGKKEIYFLEYPDGFLGDYPLNTIREKFMRFVRKIKPQIMMTFDPWAPFETHPDHRMVGMAAAEATGFAYLPLFHREHRQEGLLPHLTPECYYFAKNNERANMVVDITPYIDKKIDALCAHVSQMKLTIDDLRLSLIATGKDPKDLIMLDRENYRPIMEMGMRAVGQKAAEGYSFEYGEPMRYEKAGALFDELS